MAGGGGSRDERRESSASEVGTDGGTGKKKEKRKGNRSGWRSKNKILLLITLMWIGPCFRRLPIGVIAPVIKN